MSVITYAFLQTYRLSAAKGERARPDRRLNQACLTSDAPPSSICAAHPNADVHTAAKASSTLFSTRSAKVVLGPEAFENRYPAPCAIGRINAEPG